MEIITQKTKNIKRCLPHEISTKIHAVEAYRQAEDQVDNRLSSQESKHNDM